MTNLKNFISTRNDEIRRILHNQNVSRLCHMTQINNLMPIMYAETGIMATDFIDETDLFRNDRDRLEGKTDYISTSVEYPNTWYYRNKKYINPEVSEWAILYINPILCEWDSTLFCPVNAATGYGAYIGSEPSCLKKTFYDVVGTRSRSSKMLSCCPTDDQAEVLIYRNIPVKYIIGIAFEREHTLWSFKRLFDKYKVWYPDLFLAEELFDTTLSNKIRNGEKPREKLITKGGGLWQQGLCS